jgi:orotidine-5'-phosphate decarboxylase
VAGFFDQRLLSRWSLAYVLGVPNCPGYELGCSVIDWKPMLARNRLIVALDVPNATQARQIVQSLSESVNTYKVGKQLFTAEGPQLVRDLVSSGRKVFLDLKYHDIPNTVAEAVRSAAELGVTMLNVHASGGSRMMKAAVEAAAQSATKPLVLAVTVLTSLSDADLQEIGVTGNALSQVLRLAALARYAGCGGVVASAREAKEIRREMGEGFAIVTPGIRPAGADVGDQSRILTPAEAIASGATYLVVGRPIVQAKDPIAAACGIMEEIEAATLAGLGRASL